MKAFRPLEIGKHFFFFFSIEVTMGCIGWAPSLAKAHRGFGRVKARDGT
jgi:hypothetical protein